MKKVLLSAIVLTVFSISLILFDISCKKTAKAQSPAYVLPAATTTKLGGVIPDGTTISVDGTGKISTVGGSGNTQAGKIIYLNFASGTTEIWTSNYDGSGAQKINITLPSGIGLTIGGDVKISPDHKTPFFTVNHTTGTITNYIYACNIDGSNVHEVIVANSSMQVAY